jgi:hypothetical protein
VVTAGKGLTDTITWGEEMTQTPSTESFVGFVNGLDPSEINAKASMYELFRLARYSDLSPEVGSLPEALARAIATSDTEGLTQMANAVGGLAGEYEGHLDLR